MINDLIDLVPHNQTRRFNCPECQGYNTLGITKLNGKVMWNCFKLNCSLKKGSNKYLRNIPELKSQNKARTEEKEVFRLPTYLVHGLASENTVSMLIRGYCMEVYKRGLFDVAYDPVQDRVCFVVKRDREIVGLIGKACNKRTKPKVLNYEGSDVDVPFIVNDTDTVVLVEDCLSAISVCRIVGCSGLALLGTTLRDSYIPYIKQYDNIIIALDRDARKKALAIKNKLQYHHSNVSIWMLNSDIKDNHDLSN